MSFNSSSKTHPTLHRLALRMWPMPLLLMHSYFRCPNSQTNSLHFILHSQIRTKIQLKISCPWRLLMIFLTLACPWQI